jgi:hypothetical protein
LGARLDTAEIRGAGLTFTDFSVGSSVESEYRNATLGRSQSFRPNNDILMFAKLNMPSAPAPRERADRGRKAFVSLAIVALLAIAKTDCDSF